MSGFADSMRDWLIVVRAIHFAATATMAGIPIFRMMVAQPALRLVRPAMPIFDARILRIAWISLVISVGSGIAWVLLQAPAMSGLSFGEAMNADTIATVLTETQFGLVSEIRCALAIVLAACLAFDRLPAARWLALASAIGLVIALAWTGHAGSTAGELGFFHLASDTLHLIAAATWIGGLISLALFLAVVRRHPAHGWAAAVYDVAQRFSTLGIVSVATLLVTGVVNAGILVGSLHALLVTTYGQLLMFKIALFVIMLGFAAFNRIWLTPRFSGISREERKLDAVPKFVRNCIVEIAFGLAIFGIVGALGTLHPAKHLMSRIRSSHHLALRSPTTFGFLQSHDSGLFESRSLLPVTQPRLRTLGMIVDVAERVG